MSRIEPDYDDDPDRWRRSRESVERYGSGDVHDGVAARLVDEGRAPVLDVGCGDGRLAVLLPRSFAWIGVDTSPAQLAVAPRPAVLADATALPFRARSFAAVTALWMLYHLDEPLDALAEAHRVLVPGGLLAACTSRRDDSPELLAHLPPQPASTFDAEEAVDIVRSVFADVEVETWDAPYVRLPDSGAVAEYLLGRGIDGELAEEVAADVDVPLDVTKRGVLVWAHR